MKIYVLTNTNGTGTAVSATFSENLANQWHQASPRSHHVSVRELLTEDRVAELLGAGINWTVTLDMEAVHADTRR